MATKVWIKQKGAQRGANYTLEAEKPKSVIVLDGKGARVTIPKTQIAESRGLNGGTKPESKAKVPAAANGPCGCGCGAVPKKKGSEFMPGHDARLRGKLLRLKKTERYADSKDKDERASYREALADLKGVDIEAAQRWLAATFG